MATVSALRLLNLIRDNRDGFTIYRDGSKANIDGLYIVGGEIPALKLPATLLSRKLIFECLENWIAKLPNSVAAIGGWMDEGTYYIDAVALMSTLDGALYYGRLWEQLAIYDGTANKTVYIND